MSSALIVSSAIGFSCSPRAVFFSWFEAVTDRAVDDRVADRGDEATEHRRVDDDLDLDLLAGRLARGPRPSRRRWSSVERDRRAHLGDRRASAACGASSTNRSTIAGQVASPARARPRTTTSAVVTCEARAPEQLLDDLLRGDSPGCAGSASASRSSSLPSTMRAKRNSSSSTSSRCAFGPRDLEAARVA